MRTRITLTLTLDSPQDDATIARILQDAANEYRCGMVRSGWTDGNAFDANGNNVGSWSWDVQNVAPRGLFAR